MNPFRIINEFGDDPEYLNQLSCGSFLPMVLKTQKKYLRIDRRQICFVKFIFEAHDGLAAITTVDPQKGRVLFRIAPGCEADVDMILKDLKKEILIEPEGHEFDAQ